MPSASAPGPAGPSPFPLRLAPAPLPPGQAESSLLPLLPPRRRVSPFSSPCYSVSLQTRDICQDPALSLLKASFAAHESRQKNLPAPLKNKKQTKKKTKTKKNLQKQKEWEKPKERNRFLFPCGDGAAGNVPGSGAMAAGGSGSALRLFPPGWAEGSGAEEPREGTEKPRTAPGAQPSAAFPSGPREA